MDHKREAQCGPQCRYRALYEGSQASLNDMSRRQTDALRRTGHLRGSALALMKRYFPAAYLAAEQASGLRLSDLEDELVFAHFEEFITKERRDQGAGMAQLRAVLLSAGLRVPFQEDAGLWADALESQMAEGAGRGPGLLGTDMGRQGAGAGPSASTGGPVSSSAGGAPGVPESTGRAAVPGRTDAGTAAPGGRPGHTGPLSGPAPERAGRHYEEDWGPQDDAYASTWGPVVENRPESSGEGYGWGTAPNDASTGTAGEGTGPASAGGHAGLALSPDGRHPLMEVLGLDPDIVSDGPAPCSTVGPGQVTGPAGSRGAPMAEVAGPGSGVHRPLRSLADLAPGRGGQQNGTGLPERQAPGPQTSALPAAGAPIQQAAAAGDLHSLFGTSPAQEEAPGTQPWPQGPGSQPPHGPVGLNEAGLGDGQQKSTVPGGRGESSAGQGRTAAPRSQSNGQQVQAQQLRAQQPAPGRARTEGHRHGQQVPREQGRLVPQAPLRPEVQAADQGQFGQSRNRRGAARVARTSAAVPDALDLGSPLSGINVTETTRETLLSAVSVQKPVFMCDLAQVAGSTEAAQAWVNECMSGQGGQVGVIAAKTRHQALGPLVYPKDVVSATSKKQLWFSVVEAYRGLRVYELGVLLRKYIDDVVSFDLQGHSILLRLARPRGLVGMVVALEGGLVQDSPCSKEVLAYVGELMRERLSLAAVLSVTNDGPQQLRALLTDAAVAHKWSPAFPVVVARSWEYALNDGATADLVLGA